MPGAGHLVLPEIQAEAAVAVEAIDQLVGGLDQRRVAVLGGAHALEQQRVLHRERQGGEHIVGRLRFRPERGSEVGRFSGLEALEESEDERVRSILGLPG